MMPPDLEDLFSSGTLQPQLAGGLHRLRVNDSTLTRTSVDVHDDLDYAFALAMCSALKTNTSLTILFFRLRKDEYM